jgi:N6-adenosine-specific RNA methylase IME4
VSRNVPAVRVKDATAPVMKDRVIQILLDANKLLQQATTVHQAKLIADVAAAQQVYAKRQQLGQEVEDYAHGLKIEALARLGELLRELPKNDGARGIGRSGVPPKNPTLTDLGLDKKTSAVAQQLAALPVETRLAIARKEVSLTEARRQQRREQQPQDLALPDGKYRVVYADPPWSYGNSGVINESDNYGRAERHYPSMTIAQLCDLDVLSRVADDAVLFLWVTSPLLDECWPVIKAWGFEYKTSMVWDKVRHNYGNYVSVRHEFLLICTRGSCLPDCPTPMPDSVVSLPRSDQHSEKPEEFRQLIDRLYPRGRALELFSRWSPPKGSRWTVHGNELLTLQAVG